MPAVPKKVIIRIKRTEPVYFLVSDTNKQLSALAVHLEPLMNLNKLQSSPSCKHAYLSGLYSVNMELWCYFQVSLYWVISIQNLL